MQIEGDIRKMRVEYADPVRYYLPFNDAELFMNPLIGTEITLEYTGVIHCISCGKVMKTSFAQGFCYNCLQTAPEASESVLQPELSKAHLGIARDLEYALRHDLIDHIVYLALSPGLKVGATRHHQAPARWIDQGAVEAIPVARTPNRHIAGVMEVWLKQYFSDKTNWRDMLRNIQPEVTSLATEKRRVWDLLTPELRKYWLPDEEVTRIAYPVLKFPEKITTINLDKTPRLTAVLHGIKGQYLLLGDEYALNIRKHNGYQVKLSRQSGNLQIISN